MTWRDYPLLADREQLRRELISGTPVIRIARELGCSRGTVHAAMQHHHLRRPFLSIAEQTKRMLRL